MTSYKRRAKQCSQWGSRRALSSRHIDIGHFALPVSTSLEVLAVVIALLGLFLTHTWTPVSPWLPDRGPLIRANCLFSAPFGAGNRPDSL